MPVLTDIAAMREARAKWRAGGEAVAFVPTMGNLHAGHLSLVAEAKARAPRVVVSLFVNPLQFDRAADLAAYPRTLDADLRQLAAAGGVDAVFVPTVAVMYPGADGDGGAPPAGLTRVEVPGLSDILEGASRPGHFAGVTTVVAKLFNIVQPEVALFGEKDFQQLLLIRRMVGDLNMPVQVLGMPTVRETDGLAMSSRNGYLTEDERARAPAFYRCLAAVREGLLRGEDITALEGQAVRCLQESGLRPDYVSVRRSQDLAPAGAQDRHLVVLGAAWLGKARLIDNIICDLGAR